MSAPDRSSGEAAVPEHRIHHGGHDRFTLELEFVQMLANPQYLSYLADKKLLENEEFVAYLDYLQYFRDPTYLRYLQGILALPCEPWSCCKKSGSAKTFSALKLQDGSSTRAWKRAPLHDDDSVILPRNPSHKAYTSL